MIILSFDTFDKMTADAEKKALPGDYVFPDMETIKSYLQKEELDKVLVAYTHSEDQKYVKEIDKQLSQSVYLSDDEEEDETSFSTEQHVSEEENESGVLTVTAEEFKTWSSEVNAMRYQCNDWFPTLEEIKRREIKATKRDICYLLWLLNCPMQLTADEEKAKKYITGLIQSKVKIVTEEK